MLCFDVSYLFYFSCIVQHFGSTGSCVKVLYKKKNTFLETVIGILWWIEILFEIENF